MPKILTKKFLEPKILPKLSSKKILEPKFHKIFWKI